MQRALVLSVLLSLSAAGCLGATDDADVTPADNKSAPPVGGDLDLVPLDGGARDDVSTLATAPAWRLGEWWRVRLTSVFDETPREVTRVVAGAEDDAFLLGMPANAFDDAAMVLHVPGFGQISRTHLGFEMHDALFQPLRFPLVDGDTWETAWQTRPVTATVTVVDEHVADVTFIGETSEVHITYDARVGAITRLDATGYGGYEVLEHGYDFEGVVRVPHQHDLVLFHGRFAAAHGVGFSETPSAPVDEVTIPDEYGRLSFALILGSPQNAPGVFVERAEAPDATVYELTMTPAEDPGIRAAFFGHDAPGGTWRFAHAAAGAGIALAEGIAYHVYDVKLPEGCLLPGEGEHAHGDDGCAA